MCCCCWGDWCCWGVGVGGHHHWVVRGGVRVSLVHLHHHLVYHQMACCLWWGGVCVCGGGGMCVCACVEIDSVSMSNMHNHQLRCVNIHTSPCIYHPQHTVLLLSSLLLSQQYPHHPHSHYASPYHHHHQHPQHQIAYAVLPYPPMMVCCLLCWSYQGPHLGALLVVWGAGGRVP